MLGDRDTDPKHKDLRKTPEAMTQGANRFERGQNYFKEARKRTGELKCTFGWRHPVSCPGGTPEQRYVWACGGGAHGRLIYHPVDKLSENVR